MNGRIKLAIGIGVAVLLTTVLTASVFAQGPGGAFGWMMGGQGQPGFGRMMGGQGMMGPGDPIGGAMPAGCPLFAAGTIPANAQPISFDQAVEAVQQYLKSYGNPDLTLAEVMEFENNFYAVIKESSTGRGAFELLVNRYTGYVTPEPGPNMMWNTKYGHMAGFGGMMGMMGWWNRPVGPTALTAAQARAAGQGWLDANFPGATLADDEVEFYGYYTIDFLRDGRPAGMLSVNAYTGQVWYHTWHGAFIGEKEF